MDFEEIVYKEVGWIHLVQDRNQWWGRDKTAMNFWGP
jgi:hypothetical protein